METHCLYIFAQFSESLKINTRRVSIFAFNIVERGAKTFYKTFDFPEQERRGTVRERKCTELFLKSVCNCVKIIFVDVCFIMFTSNSYNRLNSTAL